jgi:hypothetical protein
VNVVDATFRIEGHPELDANLRIEHSEETTPTSAVLWSLFIDALQAMGRERFPEDAS